MTFTSDHSDLFTKLELVNSSESSDQDSRQSSDTAPTDYTGSPCSYPCSFAKHVALDTPPQDFTTEKELLSSSESIPSTVSSEDDLVQDVPEYDVPIDRPQQFWTDAVPASSADFAELFPSSRLLSIRHDDSTLDGNMNLRIDTRATTPEGERLTITLFHLRMRDLQSREFSLRRYCRDSGREICHTLRKSQKSIVPHVKPHFRHSWTNALHVFRHKPEDHQLKSRQASSLQRSDSGYDSIDGDFDEDLASRQKNHSTEPASSDFISLDFSNYAHVNIKRKGLKADKRYEFEYWGEDYQWQRVTRQESTSRSKYSYHLMRKSDNQIVAHIMPMSLTSVQEAEEVEMGGWVYPCTFRITDMKTLEGSADVAEAIVATGLVTLVDDSIRRHFHPREVRQLVIPMPKHSSLMLNMDYVDPKKLIDDAFGRNNHHHYLHHLHRHHDDNHDQNNCTRRPNSA